MATGSGSRERDAGLQEGTAPGAKVVARAAAAGMRAPVAPPGAEEEVKQDQVVAAGANSGPAVIPGFRGGDSACAGDGTGIVTAVADLVVARRGRDRGRGQDGATS